MTKSHARNPQVLLFFGCFAAYVCAYLSRDTFSAVMPNILSQTEITKTEIGTISTVFLIFYGCGQLISGFLGDKIRSDKLIAMGLLRYNDTYGGTVGLERTSFIVFVATDY